ncbi:hypothetical protein EXE41_17105 [Halorubrum sp. SD690R]|uniref:hypothetical protein n=1 Tax=Halorubrum sp. SD690R TaxID=2518117 RepID=UPI0010F76905|nr:hypothetical protein [Halorubrum sp. SD690R]TKX42466.1 hypothetical protein EXE41_17105 [Halorubrum sp. SD690R]
MTDIDNLAIKASGSAHCFNDRELADEHYIFRKKIGSADHVNQETSVMVEYLEDDELIIAGQRLPGASGYYQNYPDVVEENEKYQARHNAARDRINRALSILEEYDPKTYTEETYSGNKVLSAIYIRVPQDKREEAVVQFWIMLNYLRKDYYSFLREWEPDKLEETLVEDELFEHPISNIMEKQLLVSRIQEHG